MFSIGESFDFNRDEMLEKKKGANPLRLEAGSSNYSTFWLEYVFKKLIDYQSRHKSLLFDDVTSAPRILQLYLLIQKIKTDECYY